MKTEPSATSFADSFRLVQPQPKSFKAISTFCEIWQGLHIEISMRWGLNLLRLAKLY